MNMSEGLRVGGIRTQTPNTDLKCDPSPHLHAHIPMQGHIWRSGFSSGALRAQLYRDVPDALTEWRLAGIKTYIYSSGSREAQRMFFAHTQVSGQAIGALQ